MINESTVQKIESFNVNGAYTYVDKNNKEVYCPHVNGLVSILFAELGNSEKSSKILDSLISSQIYHEENGLFYRQATTDGNIVAPYFNVCKNSIMALAFYASGRKEEALKIMRTLKSSPAFDKNSGLFYREYKDETHNPLIVTQTNLWAALAYAKLGYASYADEIMRSLELKKQDRFNRDLFRSPNCEDIDSVEEFHADDQALAAIVYKTLGHEHKARFILNRLIESPMYDPFTGLYSRSWLYEKVDETKSTYKNALIGLAFAKLGFSKELNRLRKSLVDVLYDKDAGLFSMSDTNPEKIPDNSALAVMALDYERLKHIVF